MAQQPTQEQHAEQEQEQEYQGEEPQESGEEVHEADDQTDGNAPDDQALLQPDHLQDGIIGRGASL